MGLIYNLPMEYSHKKVKQVGFPGSKKSLILACLKPVIFMWKNSMEMNVSITFSTILLLFFTSCWLLDKSSSILSATQKVLRTKVLYWSFKIYIYSYLVHSFKIQQCSRRDKLNLDRPFLLFSNIQAEIYNLYKKYVI